jgi:CheY-like chemotaxis protein
MNSNPLNWPRPRTCLMVDDEPAIAEFLASVASDAGWLTSTATSKPAIELALKEIHPDLIVTDLAMPGYDGVEFIRWLSEIPYLGNLIVISACDSSVLGASIDLAMLYGLKVSGFAQKPLDAGQFERVLEQADADATLRS